MDDYNETMIKIEEDEDVKQYFNEALMNEPELNHIEDTRNSSQTNYTDYQKTIDGLSEAGEIKIEIGETDNYCFKPVFEVEEENEQGKEEQNIIDANGYKYFESKIKDVDRTNYYYGTVNKNDKDDEDMEAELTETFVEEIKSTNIVNSYDSCVTEVNDFQKIYNDREVCNTTVVKVEVDLVDGDYYESLIEVEENNPLGLQTTDYNLEKIQQFFCNICKKSFNAKWKMVQHITRSHSVSSSTQKSTKNQIINKNIMVNNKINGCHVKPWTEKEYKNQIAPNDNNSGRKPYKCTVCSKSCYSNADLIKHNRVHTGEKPFQCLTCLKSFTEKSTLTKHHKQIHLGERPYQCAVCLKSFYSKLNFTKHKRLHTYEKSTLKGHERVHTGDKLNECAVCLNVISSHSDMTNHKRVHAGKKHIECAVCSKSFSQKAILTRPYKCTVCPIAFFRKDHLINHERVHTGETPYSCTECSKSFSQKSNLTRHKRVHTGETYSCAECSKSFSQKSSLAKHKKRIHTDEKPSYRCAV